jgi:hypothetical protein
MTVRWNAERWAEVEKLRAQGLSNREICRLWGICETALSSAASKAGVATPRRPSWWTPDRAATLREMRAGGALWREIGARLGCSEGAARAYGVDRLGLPAGTQRPLAPPKPAAVDNTKRDPLPPGDPLTWNLLLALSPSLLGTPEGQYTGRLRTEIRFGN